MVRSGLYEKEVTVKLDGGRGSRVCVLCESLISLIKLVRF